jgi:Skp family chaperone for outer membrane proteins
MAQASAKLIGGISESLVTGTAAAISVGGAAKGLGSLTGKSAATKAGMKEANEVTESTEKSLKLNNNKLKGLNKQKAELDKKKVSKDSDEYRKLESDIESVEETIETQKTLKTKAETTRGELEKDHSEALRKIDLQVAKANGFSQLAASGKGFITGVTDYYVTINQANIKIQDAMQAQLQLTKDNSRMFMQKSNEYITSLLSSMLSIINSTYQARRGIITS